MPTLRGHELNDQVKDTEHTGPVCDEGKAQERRGLSR